jgi:hypothetical protein
MYGAMDRIREGALNSSFGVVNAHYRDLDLKISCSEV